MRHARHVINNPPARGKNAVTAYCTAAGKRVFSSKFPCNMCEIRSCHQAFLSAPRQLRSSSPVSVTPRHPNPIHPDDSSPTGRDCCDTPNCFWRCVYSPETCFLMPDCSTRAVFVAVPNSTITKITMSTHTQYHNHNTTIPLCVCVWHEGRGRSWLTAVRAALVLVSG